MCNQRSRRAVDCCFVALTISLAWAVSTAQAQQVQDEETITHVKRAGELHEHIPQHNAGKISFSTGADITSAYFFRGILQEDQGFIVQPWIDATVQLSDDSSLTFGIWNSFHDKQTGALAAGTGPDWWYEADLYISFATALTDTLGFDITYTAYTSPNDAFGTISEFAFGLMYDDTAMWEGTAIASGLQPSMLIAVETDGQADGGSNEGIYLQLAIEPSCTLIESQDSPVTLSVPITLGLSLGDYYEDPTSPGAADDSNFGYLDIGAVLSMPLSSIPSDYGHWEASLGVHYLKLSEATEAANANAKGDEVIFTFGISMGY